MPWYVFAVIDAAPRGAIGRGLGGPLRVRPAGGAYLVVERRADVPPPELGALRSHQAIVSRISKAVPSILPVRFGTLIDEDSLDETLADREDEIEEALTLVRNRAQFTWRRRQAARKGGRARHAPPPTTGAEYLRRAARGSAVEVPAVFRTVRTRLREYVARETFQPASPPLPDTLYHLIDKAAVARYTVAANAVASTTPALTVSGPWPPFAFAPEVG